MTGKTTAINNFSKALTGTSERIKRPECRLVSAPVVCWVGALKQGHLQRITFGNNVRLYLRSQWHFR